jgi:hypothetical protein
MEATQTQYDSLGAMMAWEEGELSDEETIKLFQYLVDTGWAWSLQGCYGRQAARLIEAGYVKARK